MENKDWILLVEKTANELGWEFSYNEQYDGISLQIYSPKGKDCCLDVDAINFKEFKRQVNYIQKAYSPDEEAVLWYGKDKGEPKSLRDLLNDMEWYDAKLKELTEKLNELL